MVRVLAPEPLPSSAIIRLPRAGIQQIVGVRVDHAGVGARQAVFGQKSDGLEERRADVVVEIPAGQSLLLGLRETGPYVARELCFQSAGEHQDSPSGKSRTRKDTTAGTSCESWAAENTRRCAAKPPFIT